MKNNDIVKIIEHDIKNVLIKIVHISDRTCMGITHDKKNIITLKEEVIPATPREEFLFYTHGSFVFNQSLTLKCENFTKEAWIFLAYPERFENGTCLKCQGTKWIWGHELDSSSNDIEHGDTRYSCDWCQYDSENDIW